MKNEYFNLPDKEFTLGIELINSAKLIQETLSRSLKRNLGVKQNVMIINQVREHLVENWNTFLVQDITNDAFFVDTMENLSYELRKILNKLPADQEYDLIRISLQSLFNFCYITISFREGKEASFKLQGIANMMAKILTGIPTLENLDLPEIENPAYINLFERYVSYLFSTQLMLVSVIQGIPMIDMRYLEDWAKLALSFQSQLKQLTATINFEIFFTKFYNRNEDQFYFNVEILHQYQFHIIHSFEIFQKIFSEEWRQKLREYGDYEISDIDSIFMIIDYVNSARRKIQEELDELLSRGILDKNNSPKNAKALVYSRNYLLFDEYKKSRYRFFQLIFEDVHSLSKSDELLEETNLHINNSLTINKKLFEAREDPNIMFKPEDMQYYIENVKDLLALISLKSIQLGDTSDLLSELNFTVQNQNLINFKPNPKLDYYKLLLVVASKTSNNDTSDFKKILSKLNDLKSKIRYDELTYISLLHLEIILRKYLFQDNQKIQVICSEALQILNDTGFIQIKQSVSDYYKDLLNVENEDSNYTEYPRKNYIEVESWLIPQFSSNGKVLKYFPVNLLHQKVIKNRN